MKKKGLSFQEQQLYKKLEKEIQLLEGEQETLQNRFLEEELTPEEITKLSIRLKEIEATLEEKSDAWLELSMLLEGAKNFL